MTADQAAGALARLLDQTPPSAPTEVRPHFGPSEIAVLVVSPRRGGPSPVADSPFNLELIRSLAQALESGVSQASIDAEMKAGQLSIATQQEC